MAHFRILMILYSSLEGQGQKERETVGHVQGFTRVETRETALPTATANRNSVTT